MNRFLLLLLGIIISLSVLAQLPVPNQAPLSLQKMESDINTSITRATDDEEWDEWKDLGLIRFPDNAVSVYQQIMYSDAQEIDYWDGMCELKHRTNTDATKEQFMFKGAFNKADLIVDYDPITETVSSTLQSTGIKLRPEVAEYEECMWRVDNGIYYQTSGKLILDMWFYIRPRYGYHLTDLSFNIPIDNGYFFNMKTDKTYISSKENTVDVEFTVSCSEQVKYWRIACFKHNEKISPDIVKSIMEGTLQDRFIDYYSKTFKLNFSGKTAEKYSIVYIPFDERNKPLDEYSLLSIYRNKQDNYNWKEIGVGLLTEEIGHMGLPDYLLYIGYESLPPQSREVIVEQRQDNPSYYRIKNPFGKNYPYYNYLALTDPWDDFYIYIDARDESRVLLEYSYVGFNYKGEPAAIRCGMDSYINDDGCDLNYLDMMMGYKWGKLFDKKITFAQESIYTNNYINYSPCPLQFVLLLPGYEDYNVDADLTSSLDQEVTITFGNSKIAKVVAALIPIEDIDLEFRFFPELIFNHIATNDGRYPTHTFPVDKGTAVLSIDEIKNNSNKGNYYLAVVQLDNNGINHGGIIFDSPIKTSDFDWRVIGTATIEENIIYSLWGDYSHTNSYQCIIEENDKKPGLYCLVNPFEDISRLNPSGDKQTVITDLYIDASDKNNVVFVKDGSCIPPGITGVNTGIFDSYGLKDYYFINSGGSIIANDNTLDKLQFQNGKMNENTISFEGNSIVLYRYGWNEKFHYDPSGYMRISINKNGDNAVEEIESNTLDGKLEYFNLQGLKVKNPHNGLFIVKQNGKTAKRYIP
ncbi:MAG: hypothetical protein K2M63_08585 [Muribaculaceae bacterium]|nr:hypothetical protein [Muribaculaceae bacterium]